MKSKRSKWQTAAQPKREQRLDFLRWFFVAIACLIVVKLFFIQIMDHKNYAALASGQHEIFKKLYPERGQVFVHDKDALVPVITNQQLAFVYADPRYIKDPENAAIILGDLFDFDEEKVNRLKEKLADKEDPYEPIRKDVSKELLEKVKELEMDGLHYTMGSTRLYPEANIGGQLLGFLGSDKDGNQKGRYGIEGYFDEELAGSEGYLKSDRDIAGNIIAVANHALAPAQDGSDLVLTIDRTIQFKVCSMLTASVKKHGADGGSVIIVDPSTGRILAMCGSPDFDPNNFHEVANTNVFNNPTIFGTYEPGSVFKPITMAAAIDAGSVTPQTTFMDTGESMVNGWYKPIRNAQNKKYGLVDMTQILEDSINTGMIFIMRSMGSDVFASYVDRFGFGKKTGIELETESVGDVSSLQKKSELYRATASFGQGISVTPLQIVMAYAAIANGGVLKKPIIVDEIRHKDGTVEKRQPQDVTQAMSPKAARTIGAMLVSVVEHGHGKQAGVKGYYIGGKTGTAQVASENGGYSETNTIGSFAGFGPIEDPKFAMIVRIDHPRDVQWAESTAAPLFGEIAKFLLQYKEVAPTRK